LVSFGCVIDAMTARTLGLVLLLLVACASQEAVTADPARSAVAPGANPPFPDFVSLVKREGDKVVNISSIRTILGPEMQPGIPELTPDDPLYDHFRRSLPPAPGGYPVRTLGSGFLISADGDILTNAHLVAGVDEVVVRLVDKRQFSAKVIGIDERTDVALIKIDASSLRAVTIGDPAQLEVGEWVAAIGSPFGFENSVTAGIVSAKGRLVPDESEVPFIQTDVAVNPGNSGGPLFNLRGEVVGVNSMIYSESGGYMGLSFAIPIDVAIAVADQLRTQGRVIRGRIGVQIQEVTPELAAVFKLEKAAGALVVSVEKASPADDAGLLPGDVILGVDGSSIEESRDLVRMIAATPPGTTIKLQVWRRGNAREVNVTVGEAVAERLRTEPAPEETLPDRLGLVLTELTPAQRSWLGIDGGLLVRGVSGPALEAGIQEADVILALNDTRTDRVADLDQALAQVPRGGTVALLVWRRGNLAYVPVPLAD
jgi:serine protease Do